MARAFGKLFLYCIGIVLIAGLTIYALNQTSRASDSPIETASVSKGTVTTIADVSGKIEAKEIAELRFPATGVVKEIFKQEGDSVIQGEIIASLAQDALVAEYSNALNSLTYQEQRKNELIRGPRTEAKTVTQKNVDIARENLARTEREQAKLVESARRILLSTNLEARPVNKANDDVPPVVTGTYNCDNEGNYTVSVFGSNAQSGYSYRLSGLGDGTYTAYVDAAGPFGDCGLSIQFDASEQYRNETWVIAIPNTESALYLENRNTYELALESQKNEVTAAEQALALAEHTQTNMNAAPTNEVLAQINAQIDVARATLALREAQIADYVIKAPYDGIITRSSINIGEVADIRSSMTLIREGSYELKARIPEVDIRKIAVGNTATALFDAAPDEPIPTLVEYVSPTSIEIDGVSYYEARMRLSYAPTWLREGLNADIDIVVEKKENVSVIPKRFVIEEQGTYYTHVLYDTHPVKTGLEVGLVGNDGFIEVMNIPVGTTVVIP